VRVNTRGTIMWHVGIDLHRETVVFAAINDLGEVRPPIRLACSAETEIAAAFEQLRPFRAVIEATRTYRWLLKLLSPMGTILLKDLEGDAQTE